MSAELRTKRWLAKAPLQSIKEDGFGLVVVLGRDVEELEAYIKRLESVALDYDAYRCDFCQLVWSYKDMSGRGEDCDVCKTCAAEIDAELAVKAAK